MIYEDRVACLYLKIVLLYQQIVTILVAWIRCSDEQKQRFADCLVSWSYSIFRRGVEYVPKQSPDTHDSIYLFICGYWAIRLPFDHFTGKTHIPTLTLYRAWSPVQPQHHNFDLNTSF